MNNSDYTVIRIARDGTALVWNGENNKLEVFQARSTAPASWHLKHGKKFLEFVRTATTGDYTILSDIYSRDSRLACQQALRLTKNIHWQNRLEVCDSLLGTFGTEAIRGDWQNGYWCDIVACYCNTGDTYATTILHVRGDWHESGTFRVSNVGDFVERNTKKLGIL